MLRFRRFTTSDYLFDILDLRLLITPIVFSHLSCAYLWIVDISQRNYISFRNLIIQSYIKVDNVACTWLCGVNWNSKRHHQRDLEEKLNRRRNETINMHILSNMNIRFLIRLDRHDIAEILLKLTLSTNQSTNKIILYTVNVLLFVGTNCRGFCKMHWSMTYWNTTYNNQWGELYVVGFLFSKLTTKSAKIGIPRLIMTAQYIK